MADEMKKCAHESCKCMTSEKYCSTLCKDSANVTDLQCQCGHPGCETRGMNG